LLGCGVKREVENKFGVPLDADKTIGIAQPSSLASSAICDLPSCRRSQISSHSTSFTGTLTIHAAHQLIALLTGRHEDFHDGC